MDKDNEEKKSSEDANSSLYWQQKQNQQFDVQKNELRQLGGVGKVQE